MGKHKKSVAQVRHIEYEANTEDFLAKEGKIPASFAETRKQFAAGCRQDKLWGIGVKEGRNFLKIGKKHDQEEGYDLRNY